MKIWYLFVYTIVKIVESHENAQTNIKYSLTYTVINFYPQFLFLRRKYGTK